MTGFPLASKAIVATAHKIARVVYHLLKTGEAYYEEHAAEYDQKRQARELTHVACRAKKLGYALTPVPTTSGEGPPELATSGSF